MPERAWKFESSPGHHSRFLKRSRSIMRPPRSATELEPAPISELYQGDLPPGRFAGARRSPSTPRRSGSTPIATGSAWCSSRPATAAPRSCSSKASYDAPELKRLLADESVLKLFHFGRFDMAVLKHYFGVMPRPVYCTKVASKLARTFTDRHGLKDLCRELLGIELSSSSNPRIGGLPS